MPIYPYKCSNTNCQETEDLRAPMAERDALQGKMCPTCGDGTLRRQFTPYHILNAGLGDLL
jgi:putative FmdB family regulatory protein